MNPALVGQRIRTARENLGLDHATLAQRMSIDRAHLQQIEAGDATLNIAHVSEVARVLRVHPFALLGADADSLLNAPPQATNAPNDAATSPLANRLRTARARAKLSTPQTSARIFFSVSRSKSAWSAAELE